MMIIVLDTNIYCQDFMLRSSKFEIFLDYLKKTNSSVVIPEIVYKELGAVFERKLSSKLDEYAKAKRQLVNALVSISIPDAEVNVSEEVEKYLRHLKEKLKVQDSEIFKYKEAYLHDVVERAIKRIRPCTDRGEEFRDALLWCSILDIAMESAEKSIIFISNNTKQFAADDGALHVQLLTEAKEKEVVISYYSSVDSFIKGHAEKIEYITSEWLLASVDMRKLNKQALEILNSSGHDALFNYVKRHNRDSVFDFDADKYLSGYVDAIWTSLSLDDYYVYEMTDGSIRIEADFSGEVEVEYEGKAKVKRLALSTEDRWSLWIDERDNEFEEDSDIYVNAPSDDLTVTRAKYAYPEVRFELQLMVREKEVKRVEIIGWEFL